MKLSSKITDQGEHANGCFNGNFMFIFLCHKNKCHRNFYCYVAHFTTTS